MKSYKYEVPVTTNFTKGSITAESEEEALKLISYQVRYNITKVNSVLNHADITKDFEMTLDIDKIVLK